MIEKAARYLAEHDKGAATFGGAKYQPLTVDQCNNVLDELFPALRGMVSQKNRFIGTLQSDNTILEFVNSVDAPR